MSSRGEGLEDRDGGYDTKRRKLENGAGVKMAFLGPRGTYGNQVGWFDADFVAT